MQDETPDNGVPCLVRNETVLREWPQGVVVGGDGSSVTITQENSAIDVESAEVAEGDALIGAADASTDRRSPLGTIAGGVAASLLAIAAAVLAVVCLWRRHRRRSGSGHTYKEIRAGGAVLTTTHSTQKRSLEGENGTDVNVAMGPPGRGERSPGGLQPESTETMSTAVTGGIPMEDGTRTPDAQSEVHSGPSATLQSNGSSTAVRVPCMW